MILPIFVAGILTLAILAPTARGADDNAGGGETQAPPAGGETARPAPPATETPPPAAAPPADLVNTILEMVNRERAAVQVPPLVWSNTLAADAQAWADHLATINNMVHSPGNFKDYAETIASWTHGDTLRTMVMSWINVAEVMYAVERRASRAHARSVA